MLQHLDIVKGSCLTEADGRLQFYRQIWMTIKVDSLLINHPSNMARSLHLISVMNYNWNKYNFWMLDYNSNSSARKPSWGTELNLSFSSTWSLTLPMGINYVWMHRSKVPNPQNFNYTKQHMTLPALFCPAYKPHDLFRPFWMYVTVS